MVGPDGLDWPAPADRRRPSPAGPAPTAVEVWLEDATGAKGPPATTSCASTTPARPASRRCADAAGSAAHELPFRDPGRPPGGAAAAGGDPRLRDLGRPRPRGTSPAPRRDAAATAETDLRGGIDDDTLVVDELPEGSPTSHAVAVSGSRDALGRDRHTPALGRQDRPRHPARRRPGGLDERPVELRPAPPTSRSGMAAGRRRTGPFTAIRVDGGRAGRRRGRLGERDRDRASGVHTVAYYARDAAGNVDDGADANGQGNAAPSATDGADRPRAARRGLPAVHRPGGPGADRGAGLRPALRARPRAAAGSASARPAPAGAFEPLPTDADGGLLRARWNSDDYPGGEYEFGRSATTAPATPPPRTRRRTARRWSCRAR